MHEENKANVEGKREEVEKKTINPGNVDYWCGRTMKQGGGREEKDLPQHFGFLDFLLFLKLSRLRRRRRKRTIVKKVKIRVNMRWMHMEWRKW